MQPPGWAPAYGAAQAGAQPAQAAQAPAAWLPVCGRCGVVAPVRRAACEVCGQTFAEPRARAPEPGGGAFWVAVRASFQCRSCSWLAPLDALDVDGSVECAHCGLEQRFDVSAWKDALAFAHAVGDLAGPYPEGRNPHPSVWIGDENPHAAIGVTETFAEIKQGGVNVSEGIMVPRSLVLEAAPGCPACDRCGVPVTSAVRGPGAVETACPQCGDRGSYALPPAAQRLCETLAGVVADEHRQGRAAPRHATVVGGGIESLRCPDCGAPLAGATSRIVRCQFCQAVCRIPARARVKVAGDPVKPDVWWVLFAGASAARRELESPSGGAKGEAEERLEKLKQTLLAKGVPKEAIAKLEAKQAAAAGKEGGSGAAPLEDAPPAPGVHVAQWVLTLSMALAALAIGLLLTAFSR